MSNAHAVTSVMARLQRDLQGVYDLVPGPDVRRFLITDRRQASQLSPLPADLQEALLVHEQGEQLDISLFVDAQLLSQLASGRVDGGNLDAWLQALEGVSHFELLVQRAQADQSVSQLELELQAEVDKFVWLQHRLTEQQQVVPPALLLRWLFDQPQLRETLDAEQRWRYRRASQLARQYCERLDAAVGPRAHLNRLRRFYRLSGARKLRAAAQH